jgi:Na+-translocating ferredoxin:NAD+ oxidoreductase RnfG subunit
VRAVFAYSVIKPGEESWLIASDSPGLTTAPAELRDRFAAIEGADRLYPPAGLMSLYSPQRSEYQSNSYEKAGDGAAKGLLLNTERAPKALLHELLFAARESGGAAWLGKFIRTFALHGFFVAPVGLLLFSLLRTLFHLNHRGARDAAPDGSPSLFDSYTLVFTTGAAGMGGIMVLMYLYQSAFGSIFLHVGLLSAIYMLGLAAGSAASARLLAGSTRRSAWLPVCAILLQVILYGGMTLLGAKVGQAVFAAAFALSGLLGGVYVPVAARRLKAAGLPHDTAGAGIEAADHIGGAVGGLVTGLLLIPVFGTTYGLALLTLLLLTNLIALRPLAGSTGVGSAPQHDRRLAGHSGYYILFGLVAFVLAAGLLLRREGTEEAQQAFLAFSRAAAGQGGSLEQRHALAHGKALQYFVLESNLPGEKASVQGYVFMTDSLAPDIPGYGGPLALAAWVAADGTLRNVAILPSRETPAYLDYLHSWLGRLSGKNLFGPDPLKDVDAVTGATLTSAAVLQILRKSGPAFAGEVLGRDLVPSVPVPHPRQLHRESLWLVAVTAAALVLRRKPSRLPRRGFLLLIVVGSGFLLNAQYSLAHVFSLLGLNPPPVGLNTAFLLVVGVPLIVALFGNIYCGYLCPFGALQELVGDLRPACLRTDPDKSAWGRARVVKYVLLAVLTLLFGTTFRHVLASGDPLITVFAEGRSLVVLCFAMLLLGLAFFYPRFWCRCLCPAGAFLALLNGVRLFKRFAPSVVPQSCQFGVRDRRELDCLCCDRCRRPGPREEEAPAGTASGAASRQVNTWLLAAAIALACLVTIRSVSMWSGEHSARRTGGMVSRGIGARPVDLKRLQSLIEQNRLSSREARFYQPAPREPGSP